MISHVDTTNLISDYPTKNSANKFFLLIKDVKEKLADENGLFGTLNVIGRLIEAQPNGEAIIVGDLHGDLKSLLKILKDTEIAKRLQWSKRVLLIFLGDYGDRGTQSIEIYHIVLTLKSLFPKQVILMRGNHEGPPDIMAFPHDLPLQLESRFGKKSIAIYNSLRELHNYLYNCVVIRERYVLLHGGAPAKVTSINDIAYAHKNHPQKPYLEEILWNDPLQTQNGTFPSPRGAGKLFGQDVTKKLLKLLNVKMLIRAHQSCPNGYQMAHGGQILTIFSRKGSPYNNKYAAYLQINLRQYPKGIKTFFKGIHQF
jgi:diadenosine tetraphosphatase ApaH/serine/threonine PP2A family protein phosphatase